MEKQILNLGQIQKKMANFAQEREWQQFHSPKNISMALTVESSELMEIFQWMSEEDSKNPDTKTREKIKEEVADVLLYTFRLADLLNINIEEVISKKMEKNARNYPIEKSKGNSKKYTEL